MVPEKLESYHPVTIVENYVGRVSFLTRDKCLWNFKNLERDNACRGKCDKKKGNEREKRIDTSATWWRVRFPVSESTEASSRSMYISRSPQSWSLLDSLSRLRIILIKITARSLCNRPHHLQKPVCSTRKESRKCLSHASYSSSYRFLSSINGRK